MAENTYIKKIETELKAIDKQITELKKKKAKLDSKLHSRYNNAMETLGKRKAEAKERVKEAKTAWRALSKGMDAAWKSLRSSVKEARKEFK